MLRIENLSKRYGDHLVFQGLNYTFSPGCVVLSDEDNTGKSTLLNILAGVMAADSGDVWVNGHSMACAPQVAKAALAYVPDNCLAFPQQTGREWLQQAAREKNTQLDETALGLADKLGLAEHLDKRFEQMSTGTRRKVFLAACALGRPAVILADGPSNGLDTPARAILAEQFRVWAQDRVVLFASHDAQLVEACGAKPLSLDALRG
ncbi:ATP-binding cassette domain-containing protein [Achromobacter sp. F4_2707]|uniref:ABC transporter ATP-binding protein n=1 Tax=Achromobacter sp. F4_2707 TaxID=3114286 RepID=UPI0039C61133